MVSRWICTTEWGTRWRWRSFPPAQADRVMKTYPLAGYVVIVPSAWAGGKERQRHLVPHSTVQMRWDTIPSYWYCANVCICVIMSLWGNVIILQGDTGPFFGWNSINKGWSKKLFFWVDFFWPTSDINILETVYLIYLKINLWRVASGDSMHINF